MAFRIFMSPWNYVNLHAYKDFSAERIKLTQRVAQSPKDEDSLIQTIHAGEFPTAILLPNKVTEKGRWGSRFSVGLKGGRVSKVKTNKWAHFRNGGWVSWGPKLWQHISARAPQDTAEATQAGNLPPRVTRGPRIRLRRFKSHYCHWPGDLEQGS